MIYAFNTPIILTDDIFQAYGGVLADTLPEMRQAAYQIAEQFASEDLETYLLPTTVTGTYAYAPRLVLDHAMVNRVDLIRFYDIEERLYWTVTGTANVYASLRDSGEYGIVDLHQVVSNCGCGGYAMPYKIEVVYNTGYSSGSSYQPTTLMALTMAARIVLNELQGFGNESSGDIGVQRFSNQDYSETRVGLIRTVYGSSAQAQLIHKMLSGKRKYRYVGL